MTLDESGKAGADRGNQYSDRARGLCRGANRRACVSARNQSIAIAVANSEIIGVKKLLKFTTAAILALSLSLAPASAREFHSGHARGFNGHAGGFHNFNRHAAGGFHSGGWHGGGYGRYGRYGGYGGYWGSNGAWIPLAAGAAILGGAAIAAAPYYGRGCPAGYYLASDGACYPAY